jgi:glyoxylase-like metal-dependent hydrolase (beta-lactamase superfamily II)
MLEPPTADQIEINIFGPGYGECCLFHFGGGKWIIIDSCVDDEIGQPAALAYLDNIGINPAEGVELVIASHWHDDHVKGYLKWCGVAREPVFVHRLLLIGTSLLPFYPRMIRTGH